MRRTAICCALFALTVAACSSSASATWAPPANNVPRGPQASYAAASAAPQAPQAPQASYAAASAAPQDHWRQTPAPAPTYDWQFTAPPASRATPYPPVSFPSLGVNPYVDTVEDHLSTFGLDVDTASYGVARAYIAQGLRPDGASVRPEEWVNYFDQSYPAPETGAFAIHVDGGPTPFLSGAERLLRVGVRARDTHFVRRPMALTFVIDCSGSMADGDRLGLVKQSLRMLVEQMRPQDRIAIVGFSTEAWVVMEPSSVEGKSQILSAIDRLRPLETTNAEAGLRLGYQLERRQRIEGGVNRVVLATDGVANTGNTSASTILDEVGADAGSGIQLVAVGVGMGNYNDAFLEKLADRGQGFYDYVDTLEEARRIFVDKLATTFDTVALDAKAQIDFNPEAVAGYRLIGYEDRGVPDSQFRNPNATGGAIGAGHQVTALYAIVLRSPERRDDRLGTVTLHWTDPSSKGPQEIRTNVGCGDLAPSFSATDPQFKLDALVAATAEVLRNSPWIPGYGISDLREAAKEIAGQLPRTDDTRDFLQLIDQLARLPQ